MPSLGVRSPWCEQTYADFDPFPEQKDLLRFIFWNNKFEQLHKNSTNLDIIDQLFWGGFEN